MCKLTYKVQRNEDIAFVTNANYRNWLLGEVKIHLKGIQDDGTTVEFDLWQFRTTGDDIDHNAQCLYFINGVKDYFRNEASSNKKIKKEYHTSNLKMRNEIITEWMRRKEINHMVVEVNKVGCKRNPHNIKTI